MRTSLAPLLLMTVASIVTRTDAYAITQPLLIDLSHVIDENTTPTFPLIRPFNLTNAARDTFLDDTFVIEFNVLSIVEHVGTSMDATNHIRPVDDDSLGSVGEVPLENTVAPGVMIDCEREAEADPGYMVPLSKILEWERRNGRIPNRAAVLFNFGYSKHFVNNQRLFRGTDNPNDFLSYIFPTVSDEAVQFLIDQRDMLILGVDTISPELPGRDGQISFPVHRLLFSKGRIIIENLNNLAALPYRGFVFSAAPAKVIGPTGLPVRAYATLLDEGRNRPHVPVPRPYRPRGFLVRLLGGSGLPYGGGGGR